MASPSAKLTESLTALKTLQDTGRMAIRSEDHPVPIANASLAAGSSGKS